MMPGPLVEYLQNVHAVKASGGGVKAESYYNALAVMHAPAYRAENAGALKQDWPRIPLPASPEALQASAALGRRVAALLDPSVPVEGVTAGTLDKEISAIARVTRADGKQVDEGAGDLAVTARWGYLGSRGQTMPGPGQTVERMGPEAQPAALGAAVVDVYLNDHTRWAGVPSEVWAYTLGGYPVLKKWLSYRQREVLGRDLRWDEADHVRDTARRIAALLLLADELDAAYAASRETAPPEA